MINLKVLSAAAVMALALPMMAPTESLAQAGSVIRGGGGGGHAAGGGGGFRGGGAAIGGGGGFRGGGGAAIGGGGFRGGGGGVAAGPRFGGGSVMRGGAGVIGGGGGPRYSGGGNWHGGHGNYRRYGYGGFGTGLVIGGALGSSYGYYGAAPYGYYDDGYYDDEPAVAVAPAGGDDVEYCRRTYRSYDVRSGTYLGYDGQRHACP